MKGTDIDSIKSATEELQKAFYDISSKIYQQNQPNPETGDGAGAQGGANGEQENVYDADYKVVDEEDK